MKWVLILAFTLNFLPESGFAETQTACKGEISIGKSGFRRPIFISFESLEIQSEIFLATPLASDLEPTFSLEVVKIQKRQRGTRVQAVYGGGLSGTMSFIYMESPTGQRILKNVQGVEEGIPFGPATLICE